MTKGLKQRICIFNQQCASIHLNDTAFKILLEKDQLQNTSKYAPHFKWISVVGISKMVLLNNKKNIFEYVGHVMLPLWPTQYSYPQEHNMHYIKSSNGGGTVLNQSLILNMRETLPNILIPIILKSIKIWDFRKQLNGKNTLFGCKIMYNVLTLFLNLTVFLGLVAKNCYSRYIDLNFGIFGKYLSHSLLMIYYKFIYKL